MRWNSGLFGWSTKVLPVLFPALLSATPPERYAVVLAELPAASRTTTRAAMMAERTRVLATQANVRASLEERSFEVTGSASLLVNAVFVSATPDRLGELQSLPGVQGVVRLRRYKRTLNKALGLMAADTAWTAVGGFPNAGKGIKIAVLDSGVDQNHPSMQDNALTVPAGFPRCDTARNCAEFTNSKVIVARSYVGRLVAGGGVADDVSARDRSGHGTAVATCAAGNSSTGSVPISGVAPKAWVGSYKIFGSPQVNDFTSDDVIIAALEDAIADGMDVISMSVGGTAYSGPLDSGAACGNKTGVACDIAAAAFEAAAQKGALIVVASGNAGAEGLSYPTFGTVASPGTAPSVITVGATTNSHGFEPSVRVPGAGIPANISNIPALTTDSFSPQGAYGAPLIDVAKLGGDGYACAELPAGSVANAFALIQRGPVGEGACAFSTKMKNAVAAGAAGVIFYDYPDNASWPFHPTNLSAYDQPAVIVANADGVKLKAWLETHAGATVIIDPAGTDTVVTTPNQLAYYSSMGPVAGTGAIKPDIVTVGGGGQNGDLIYMGAQSWDPLGDVYSATGYIAAAGTSFATPLTAGAAALVRQARPGYSAAQVKSALVNTAGQDVLTDDSGDPVNVTQVGGGRVAVDQALKTNVTVVPSSVSFGQLAAGALPARQVLQFANTGSTAVSLVLAVVSTASATSAPVALDKTTLALGPGETGTVTASIAGSIPATALYYGAITVAGGAVPLRIPWMFVVGSTRIANFVPVAGDGNDGATGQVLPDGGVVFRLTDANGVGIANSPVTFRVNTASAPMILSSVSARTDAYGYASATATAGSTAGAYSIEGCAGTCSLTNQFEYTFTGTLRMAPAVSAGGVVSATGPVGTALAPGSYFSIYGAGLADTTAVTSTARLPIAMAHVSVSFEVPAVKLSVPAPIVFVSGGQINAQVPWELAGQTSAQLKVVVNGVAGAPVTVAIAGAVPAFFENPIGSGVVAAIDPLNAANPIITAANQAKRGSVIALYANGLGAVDNGPASGEPASLTTLARTSSVPVVTIGGVDAPVAFSGLTPGLPGLYQINVTVPAGIGTGSQAVTLTLGGVTARGSLPVQ